jgi:hypothetical protein
MVECSCVNDDHGIAPSLGYTLNAKSSHTVDLLIHLLCPSPRVLVEIYSIMESSGSIHPLLMERPRSSGVDAEAFSFAKPASHRKPFSLRKLPNTTPLSQSANNDAQPSKQQTEDEGGFNGQLAQLEAYVFSPESMLHKLLRTH